MRLWIAALALSASALTLAACHKADDQTTQNPTATAAKPANVETPQRKAGLWKQSMSIEGTNIKQVASLCLDNQSDKKIAWWAQQGLRGGCGKNDVQRQPDGSWKFSSSCEMAGGIKMDSEGVATGDFGSKYEVKATTTTTGAPMAQMNGTRTVVIDAEWTGPCPAGMKGGDIELPDGRRVNMMAMAAKGANGDAGQ